MLAVHRCTTSVQWGIELLPYTALWQWAVELMRYTTALLVAIGNGTLAGSVALSPKAMRLFTKGVPLPGAPELSCGVPHTLHRTVPKAV